MSSRSPLAGFAERWKAIDAEGVGALPIETQVDHRLLGAAMARAHWELAVLRNWARDAVFLTSQVLGPWFDLLLPPPPFDARRQSDLVRVLQAIPEAVEQAIANLERDGVATLARVAAEDLHDIGARLERSVSEVVPLTDAATAAALRAAQPGASAALERFRAWLEASADGLGPDVVVRRDAFTWYLRHVALSRTIPTSSCALRCTTIGAASSPRRRPARAIASCPRRRSPRRPKPNPPHRPKPRPRCGRSPSHPAC